MLKRLGYGMLAMLLFASIGSLTSAGAKPKADAQAEVIGNVKLNKDGTASVKGRYICRDADEWHLWVSAKQVEDGSRDPALTEEGSSQFADAWLQSHPTTFRCDGKWHTQKFTIDTEEQGFGNLVKGDAWVQFCLIDEPSGQFLIDQRWAKAR